MMKTFSKLIGTFLSLILITFISGCGGGGSDTTTQTGTAILKLTDAPTDDANIKGVFVTFTGLRYQYADSNESWEDVDLNESRTIDLLTLQDGNTTLLNKVELPAGEIDHVRFILDLTKCYITFHDTDKNTSLEVSSGEQTGYKAIGGFTIPAGGTVNITADFDVRKSITATGNGRYKLNPTIKIIDNVQVGEISGTLTLNLDENVSSVIIYAYEDGTWDESEIDTFTNSILSTDGTDGSYVLPWLATGVYDLVVTSQDVNGTYLETLEHVYSIPVLANETTIVDIPQI